MTRNQERCGGWTLVLLRASCTLGLQLWCLPWSLRPKDMLWTRGHAFLSWHSGDEVSGLEIGCQGQLLRIFSIVGKIQWYPYPYPKCSHHLIFKKSSTDKRRNAKLHLHILHGNRNPTQKGLNIKDFLSWILASLGGELALHWFNGLGMSPGTRSVPLFCFPQCQLHSQTSQQAEEKENVSFGSFFLGTRKLGSLLGNSFPHLGFL